MADRYWVGGTANWDGTAGTKWATTSGGAGGASVPTSADDVFFDAASTGTCTIAAGNTGAKSINCTGFTGTLAGTAAITVSGSITLVAGMTYTYTGTTTINATATLTTAGQTLSSITINGSGITVTLGDDILLGSNRTLTLTQGTFNANNYNVTIGRFSSSNSNTRTITMGSGLWSLSGDSSSFGFPGEVWQLGTTTNLTFNKDTANIILTSTASGSSRRKFIGGARTYNKLTIGGTTGAVETELSGVNTFSELASTKTVSYNLLFENNQTINTWSLSGSAGNPISVRTNSTRALRTLTITNRTSSVDYLYFNDVSCSNLTPITFYAGANSTLGANCQGIACKNPIANEYIYVLNTGTSWTVPADWNSSNNEIHLFAGGGGAAAGRYTSGTNRAGGGGGGGGGYTKVTNLALTPSSSVSYAIGAAGSGGSGSGGSGVAGGNTTFNSGVYTTTGGGGGSTTDTPTSTGGAAGTGSTNNGGVGGDGFTSTTSATAVGGGGGAGAGGALGAGANGGNGSGVGGANTGSGGGGGGNGGGSAGSNASGATNGAGGNNANGVGGGDDTTLQGFNGGGSRGNNNSLRRASCGVDIANAGLGGGGGGGGGTQTTNTVSIGGFYGAGGGGGGVDSTTNARNGADGAQGGIIIWYSVGAAPAANGNFFFLFGQHE